MGKKNYSPVQVRNPTSLQHLSVIRPGQDLEVSLDHDMFPGEINLEISSGHLMLYNVNYTYPGRTVYTLKHDLFVSDWPEFSAAMLGEVWVDAKDTLAKLIVVMDCLNAEKDRSLTVVNPDCYDVKLKPYGILEVVLFEEDFSGNDEWVWEWMPTTDLEIEEIGYNNLNLYSWNQFASYDVDSPNSLYARHPRFEVGRDVSPWSKQHHFWFRFDNSILDLMDKNFGVNRVGDIRFTGYSNRYRKGSTETKQYSMSVYVDLRGKFKTKVLDTLHVRKESESETTTQTRLLPAPVTSGTGIVHLKQHKKKKKRKHREVVLPLKREVTINKVPFGSLEDGCKVLSCSPEMDRIPECDPYDGYDCQDYGDCDDYYQNGGLWKRMFHGATRGIGHADIGY